MLHVIEYLSNSLKEMSFEITPVKEERKSQLVFHRNYVCISYRFGNIQHQIMSAGP